MAGVHNDQQHVWSTGESMSPPPSYHLLPPSDQEKNKYHGNQAGQPYGSQEAGNSHQQPPPYMASTSQYGAGYSGQPQYGQGYNMAAQGNPQPGINQAQGYPRQPQYGYNNNLNGHHAPATAYGSGVPPHHSVYHGQRNGQPSHQLVVVQQPQPMTSRVVPCQNTTPPKIHPTVHLTLSIIGCFCCWLTGLIAIVFSVMALSSYSSKRYHEAKSYGMVALSMNVISFFFGIIFITIFILNVTTN